MAILQASDYPSIRNKIDYRLTAKMLPDSVIADFVEEAELEVEGLVSDASTRTGDEAKRVKQATIYWSAYLLYSAIPQLTEQMALEFRESYEELDRMSKMQLLMDRRDRHLAKLEVYDTPTAVFELDGGYKESLDDEMIESGFYQEFPQVERRRRIFGQARRS